MSTEIAPGAPSQVVLQLNPDSLLSVIAQAVSDPRIDVEMIRFLSDFYSLRAELRRKDEEIARLEEQRNEILNDPDFAYIPKAELERLHNALEELRNVLERLRFGDDAEYANPAPKEVTPIDCARRPEVE
jgi:hypothetical protein